MASHQTQHCSERQIISSRVDTPATVIPYSIPEPKVISSNTRIQSGICGES
jgi:hypothetical protein